MGYAPALSSPSVGRVLSRKMFKTNEKHNVFEGFQAAGYAIGAFGEGSADKAGDSGGTFLERVSEHYR